MARLSTYTKDVNLTGKDMLAGSNYVTTVNGVDQFETNNFTLKKVTEFINGQIVTDPSIISLKTNGGLVYETVNDTNFLAVDLSATNITGQLANSDLVNSSITINGTLVALGGSITIGEVTEVIAGTYLNGGGTEGTITLNHDNTTRTNTTSTATPTYGGTFTAIDSIVTNATGHITDVNTKTITIPASDNTNTTYTQEAVDSSNDAILRLVGSDSTNDDIKLKAGANITLNVNEGTDEITIASQAFGNVFTVNSEAAMITATSTGGDLVVRTDVSKTFIHNGGTTGTVADFTELQFSGINTLNITPLDGIDTNTTLLTQSANSLEIENSLATTSERGGIQIGYTENGKNYPVELDSEKAYVNVPWTDTIYTLPVATNSALGGIKIGYTDNGKNYAVELDGDNEAYVNVPWTDTVYTLPLAADGTRGGVQIGYSENGKNYPVELDNEKMFVNVPWTDNNDNTQNTYDISIPASTTKLRLSGTISGASDTTDDIEFIGSGATTVTRTDENTFTISSTDTDNNDNTTYGISCVDGDNTDEEKIRLTGSDSTTDDVILEAGTGLSIARSGDKITYTNTVTDTTNWNWQVDSNTPTNVSAGETVTLNSGGAISISTTGENATINHVDTSSVSNLEATSRTYVDALTFDTYGHVTGYTTSTETVTDTNTFRPVQADGTAIGDTETLNLIGGTNVTLSESNGAITITATDTNTDTNTTYDLAVPSGTTYVRLSGSDGTTDDILITGSGSTTVTRVSASALQISSTDTNTTYTAGNGMSLSGTQFSADINYISTSGSNNYIELGSNRVQQNIPTNAIIAYKYPNNDNIVSYGRVDDLPFTNVTNNNQLTNGAGYLTTTISSDVTFTTNTKLNLGTGVLWQGYHDGSNGYLTNITGNYYIRNTAVNADLFIGVNQGGSVNNVITIDGSSLLTTIAGSTTLIKSSSGNADLYLGNVISASSSIKGARFHSNDADFYFDFQGDSTQNWFLRDYDGSGGIHTRFGFDFINATFTASGDIVAYGSPSDITLKENIKPIENALDKVEKLQGVTFNWKEPGLANLNKDIGFIAQDVQKVLPELVRENENGKLSLRHQGIVPILLEAIKELSDKVKELENGITK